MITTSLQNQPFSLVLSGGGALGIAHLGVLHDMAQHQLHPTEVVGTSMGGIIAACMAVGMDETEIYSHIQRFSKVTNWLKFSFSGNGIVDNSKIAAIFEQLFGQRTMNQTTLPLKLIATHLATGKKRVFSAEDKTVCIKDALLATMAIPGIFEAHTIEGEVYGDGFLCENLGILEATYTQVLAVDVLGSGSFEHSIPQKWLKTKTVLEMFERSMRLLIFNQTRLMLQHTDKQIYLIEPDTKAFATYQFHRYEAIRALGLGLL